MKPNFLNLCMKKLTGPRCANDFRQHLRARDLRRDAGSDASGDTSSAVRGSAQEPAEETSQNQPGFVGILSVQREQDASTKSLVASASGGLSGLYRRTSLSFHRVKRRICLGQEAFDRIAILGVDCNTKADGEPWSFVVVGNAFADTPCHQAGRLCVGLR